MLLKGKTAVVTGCNRGIGLAVLEVFAENGADIFACVRKLNDDFTKTINELQIKNNVSIVPVYFDLSNADEVKSGIKEILSAKKTIDILINNAGIVGENRLFTMTNIEDMKKVFEVNFFAPILLTQYIIRHMAKHNGGSIVNISSIAAIDGDPAQLEYVSSKSALIGATKKLAIELGDYKIRVNCVAPGLTKTKMVKSMSDELFDRTINKTIMKRLAEPKEIANCILFLASDMASYITGQVIRVDGGSA